MRLLRGGGRQRGRLRHIDAHAHHGIALRALCANFNQNAAEFALPEPQIVGPFHTQFVAVLRIERLRQAVAHHDRQAGHIHLPQRKAQRKRQRAARRLGEPLPPHAATPGRLPLSHQQRGQHPSSAGTLQQGAVAGIQLG